MERFTKKREPSGLYITIDDELVCSDYGISYEKAVDKKVLQACDKLGKLEDIEEELGIDLITLFKAVKEGFYYKVSLLEIVVMEAYSVMIDLESSRLVYYDISFNFEDYEKTWALTKEELI